MAIWGEEDGEELEGRDDVSGSGTGGCARVMLSLVVWTRGRSSRSEVGSLLSMTSLDLLGRVKGEALQVSRPTRF